jgi:hypothetical protein
MVYEAGNGRPRLLSGSDEVKSVGDDCDLRRAIDYILAPKQADNDAILNQLKPGSLVVNATGLGKDAPGSPITYDG